MTHIKVLQHHIDTGKRGRMDACPIAQALKEQFPEAEWVAVDGGGIDVTFADRMLTAPPPEPAVSFMARFDQACAVQPFGFDAQFTERPRERRS